MGNSDHVVVSVSIDFPTNSKGGAPFHSIAYNYSCGDWDDFHDNLRDTPCYDIFKLSTSAAISELREWVQVGIDVLFIQVKPHSSPWFSAACSDRPVIVSKGFLNLQNLHMLIIQKSPSLCLETWLLGLLANC